MANILINSTIASQYITKNYLDGTKIAWTSVRASGLSRLLEEVCLIQKLLIL